MLILLRLIHVLSAIFWAGTVLFTTFYLFPTLRAAGPSAAPVITGLEKRGFLVLMPVTGLITLLSGTAILWVVSGGDVGAYSQTPPGRMFTMAGGLAIVAFLLGVIVTRPAGTKLMKLTPEVAAMPDGPPRAAMQTEIAALHHRAAMSTKVISVLIILAASGMAIARYM